MPKPFTDEQRVKVRRALIEAGRTHFGRHGYRKASVEAIARQAGIGKGSVYLFFDSKAVLFAAVARHVEEELRGALLEELSGDFDSPQERIAQLLRSMMETFATEPILRLLAVPEEAQAFFRDLPAREQRALRESDAAFFGDLVTDWVRRGWLAPIAAGDFVALLHALFAVSLGRRLVDPEAYPRVVNLLIASLSATLAP